MEADHIKNILDVKFFLRPIFWPPALRVDIRELVALCTVFVVIFSSATPPRLMEIPKGRKGHYTVNDSLADEVQRSIRLGLGQVPRRRPSQAHQSKFRTDGFRFRQPHDLSDGTSPQPIGYSPLGSVPSDIHAGFICQGPAASGTRLRLGNIFCGQRRFGCILYRHFI
jgi:hypothetical protein